MLRDTFPSYQSPAIAARWGCVNCHAPLDAATLQDHGYPQGRGQYALRCGACGMLSFFDLIKPSEQ